MKIKAYAKINIALDVVGKRDDGYHLLKMIMQPVDLYDIIELEKCNSGINLKCNKHYVPTDEKNLAYKAAKLFMEAYSIESGVNINIIKNIPVFIPFITILDSYLFKTLSLNIFLLK